MNLPLPLLVLALAAAPAAERRVIDRVAATVNGEVVTLHELEQRAPGAFEDLAELPPGPERDRARADLLRRVFEVVVADKLFEGQAKQLGVEITDRQVDQQIAEIKERNRFSDEDLERALRSEGLDMPTFRQQLRTQLQNFSLLQMKVGSRVRASEEDLRAYYRAHPQEFAGEEEVRVRHIFLPLPQSATPADIERVDAEGRRVLQRLRAGEDFGTVAQQVSRGPAAEDGGDLGWVQRGTLDPALDRAAFSLKDGQISGLVRAGPGLHIVKVEGHRRGGARSFEEAREEIHARLLEEQGETLRKQYIAELRREAVVDVKIPELAQ